ncbi:MAG: branched-chain amino acid ABC transporter permease [Promethearchaeota archaeon]
MMLKKIHKKILDIPSYLKTWVKTFSGGLTIFILFDLFAFPFLSQDPSFQNIILRQFSLALIFSIFAASWDFLAGIAGQVSFGHTIFLGIAGYICAYLINYQHYPIWVSILMGALGAVLFGLIIGIPCLRLKGPYLALGTLAFALVLLKIFNMGSLANLFFGSEGIHGLPKLSYNPTEEYIFILITMIISFIALIQISKSKFGTILKSIRDDELGSETSGINITKYKIYAYMISAFFAGLAGSFYALFTTSVNPMGNFGTTNSFFAIIMASLGGIATISGAALGAFFFIILEYVLIQLGLETWVFLIFSLILIIVIRFAENGILRPLIERLKELWDVLLGR